ncbi:MAG: hypothetical protein DMF88_12330 [Acidobacteria bacterium]|nr:MAG: hypothetical protein DMF88_12330 [Acidobacteriota bacterium]
MPCRCGRVYCWASRARPSALSPMYQVEAWSALRGFWREPSRAARWAVTAIVIALGFTSLFTDISSEMVATVLPVYLVVQLGMTPLQFGLVDGLYQGATALLSVAGGFAADRWRRHKEVAAAGYGISAVCRIGMTLAGSAWPLIAGIVALDRFGKGIRTAPRDALISLSSDRANRGVAFGVHRAFDSAGAMLGPLVGLVILSALPQRFDVVFVVSFSIAIIGLGVLLAFVRNPPPVEHAAQPRAVAWRATDARAIAPLLVAAAVLSVATVSDAFIYLIVAAALRGHVRGLSRARHTGRAFRRSRRQADDAARRSSAARVGLHRRRRSARDDRRDRLERPAARRVLRDDRRRIHGARRRGLQVGTGRWRHGDGDDRHERGPFRRRARLRRRVGAVRHSDSRRRFFISRRRRRRRCGRGAQRRSCVTSARGGGSSRCSARLRSPCPSPTRGRAPHRRRRSRPPLCHPWPRCPSRRRSRRPSLRFPRLLNRTTRTRHTSRPARISLRHICW